MQFLAEKVVLNTTGYCLRKSSDLPLMSSLTKTSLLPSLAYCTDKDDLSTLMDSFFKESISLSELYVSSLLETSAISLFNSFIFVG